MTAQKQPRHPVTVYGGSGFVGRHVVRALAQRGYRIRVAVRRPDLACHLQPLGRVGQIHAVQANLRNAASVEAAARDANVLVNLVGILAEGGRQTFDAVHAFGAEQVALAASNHGAGMVHVSAIGADENSAVALRPLQGGGRAAGAGGAAAGGHHAAVDRVRAGRRFLQPLRRAGAHVAGAAADRRRADALPAGLCRRCRRGDRATPSTAMRAPAAIYELGGPEVRTFKQLMQFVLATTERKRLLVPLPFFAAKLKAMRAAICAAAADAHRRPGRTVAHRQRGVGCREGRRAHARRARHRRRSRWRPSCRLISGASARPASSAAAPPNGAL